MNNQKIKNLSVTIIARDEELDIEDCLKSVADLADEIVLVDSGSKDRTLEIARKYTDKIFFHEWAGYSAQKQFALEQTHGAWVLNLDADERVSPKLANQMRKALEDPADVHGFTILFAHYFRGKRLRFGGMLGEKHLRLFKREAASYGKEKIHEGIRVDGRIALLVETINHYSYRDLREYLNKCNQYTSLIAQKKYADGKRFHFWHHLRLPLEFIGRYFIQLGILDGEAGLTYAAISSYYAWLKFAKLRDIELQNKEKA